jgi:hypothetical protein
MEFKISELSSHEPGLNMPSISAQSWLRLFGHADLCCWTRKTSSQQNPAESKLILQIFRLIPPVKAPFLPGDRFRHLISQNHKEIESSSSSGTSLLSRSMAACRAGGTGSFSESPCVEETFGSSLSFTAGAALPAACASDSSA